MTDNVYVDCSTCREALSARLDGEDEGVPAEEVDAHLETCADCQEWQETAISLNRTLRVRPATAVPDLAAAILDAAPPITPPAPRGWLPRTLLGGVAIAQLTLGLAQVLGTGSSARTAAMPPVSTAATSSTRARPGISRWDSACSGPRCAPPRPRHAARHRRVRRRADPLSASDLVSGTATAGRVLSHSLLLAALALLALTHFRDRGPGSRTSLQDNDSTDAEGSSDSHREPSSPISAAAGSGCGR